MYLNKRERSKWLTVVAVLSVLLALALGLLLWQKFGGGALSEKDGKTPTQQQSEYPETPDQEAEGGIQTPYLTLYFDEALVDHLAVVHNEGPPYTLEFYAVLDDKPEQHLYDIRMGDGADGNLGIIETDAGRAPVSMIIYAFSPDESWTHDEINTIHAMQESVNDLIDQLMKYQVGTQQGPEYATQVPESNLPRFVEIQTPFCTLLYPARQQAYLQTEQEESENYSVKFYAALEGKTPILLFTVIFGGDDGEQLGVVRDSQGRYVTANLRMEELSLPDCSQEDMTIIYEMQEAVNSLIEQMPLE